MAEQSAVEWLETNFPKIGKSIDMATSFEIHLKFQQAKRKHEQQLKEAYKAGQDNGYEYRDGGVSLINGEECRVNLIDAEEYYQQTYKK